MSPPAVVRDMMAVERRNLVDGGPGPEPEQAPAGVPQNREEAEAMLRAMAGAFSLMAPGGAGGTAETRPPPPAPAESAPVALLTVDASGVVRDFDPTAERIFGYAAEEVVGRHVRMVLTSPDDDDLLTSAQTASLLRGPVGHRPGGAFAVELTALRIEPGGGPLWVLAVRDVEEYDAAEAKRRKMEARYRSLVEQIPAITFMGSLNEEMNELYVSPQIESLLGFSQDEWVSDPFLWYRQ
ncbi:MAG: hypothetical protein QOD06_3305, partial [Candidatus Binatota bacterium]|nr:hypothetical protein [Candidatus Binatota bacterium]